MSPWRALLCYDKGQSKQDINRDDFKKEKHSAHRVKEGRFLSCVRVQPYMMSTLRGHMHICAGKLNECNREEGGGGN